MMVADSPPNVRGLAMRVGEFAQVDLVGGAGIEPVASSVSVKPGLSLAVVWWALTWSFSAGRSRMQLEIGCHWLFLISLATAYDADSRTRRHPRGLHRGMA